MQKWIFTIALCLCVVACKQEQTNAPIVAPLKIDLPVSYKSDTVAYNFIKRQAEQWSGYGKNVARMYKQGEKFKKKNFDQLSPRQELALVKLDYEYALLWTAIDQHVSLMLRQLQEAVSKATPQGQGKLKETQYLFMAYYTDLSGAYGKDLGLDKKPYVFSEEENAVWLHQTDSLKARVQDSVLKAQDALRKKTEEEVKQD